MTNCSKSPRVRRTKKEAEALKREFLDLAKTNKNVKEICTKLGILSDRIHKWEQSDPAFAAEYKQIKEARDVKIVHFGASNEKQLVIPHCNKTRDKKNAAIVLALIKQRRLEICELLGIGQSTLVSWLRDDKSFKARWMEMHHLMAAEALHYCVSILRDPSQKPFMRMKAGEAVMKYVRSYEYKVEREEVRKLYKEANKERDSKKLNELEEYEPADIDESFTTIEHNQA